MNYEIPSDPPPGADVDGFTYHRDQRGAIIARCVVCKVGFVITSETAKTARANMITHLDTVHGRVAVARNSDRVAPRLLTLLSPTPRQCLGRFQGLLARQRLRPQPPDGEIVEEKNGRNGRRTSKEPQPGTASCFLTRVRPGIRTHPLPRKGPRSRLGGNAPGSLWTTRVHRAPPPNLRQMIRIVPPRAWDPGPWARAGCQGPGLPSGHVGVRKTPPPKLREKTRIVPTSEWHFTR